MVCLSLLIGVTAIFYAKNMINFCNYGFWWNKSETNQINPYKLSDEINQGRIIYVTIAHMGFKYVF